MTEGQTRDLAHSVRKEHARKMVDAEARQKVIAKDNKKDHRSVNGLGRPVATFDAEGYMDLKARQNVGAQDGDFMKWVVKRHPEVTVKCTGTKIQSGYSHIDESDWPFPKPSQKGKRYLKSRTVYK